MKTGQYEQIGWLIHALLYCWQLHKMIEEGEYLETGWLVGRQHLTIPWVRVIKQVKDTYISCVRHLLCNNSDLLSLTFFRKLFNSSNYSDLICMGFHQLLAGYIWQYTSCHCISHSTLSLFAGEIWDTTRLAYYL